MLDKLKNRISEKGITLIALVVTVIIILILAGITLTMLLGENGVLKQAENARVTQAIAEKREEVEMAIADEFIGCGNVKENVTITGVVEKIKRNYPNQNMKNSIDYESTSEDGTKFPGDIIYNPPSSTIEDSIYISVSEDLEIIGTGLTKGITAKKSTYDEQGDICCNSPDLSGFNPRCTYYVTYDGSGNAINAGRIDETDAPQDWYDYNKERQKWANIVTINNGNTTYWVWIPRFKYKTPTDDPNIPAKTTDVKFVSANDECRMKVNGTFQNVDVSSYKLPDSFIFNDKQLTGYWVSKYKLQEGTNDESADTTYANVEVDASGFNPNTTKYVEYDNSGNIQNENTKIQLSEDGKLSNKPNNWYNYREKRWANIVTENNGNKTYWTYIPRYQYKIWPVTKMSQVEFIKDNKGATNGWEISDAFSFDGKKLKGYWVSKYKLQEGTPDGSAETTIANIKIDLSGFNPDVTRYVLYDNEGNETIGDKIQLNNGEATNMPQGWYDYSKKKWANIVTENEGMKTYWTYIPRYQYKTWPTLKMTQVEFLQKNQNKTNNWKLSDAFQFGGQQLDGYWVSKYKLQQ